MFVHILYLFLRILGFPIPPISPLQTGKMYIRYMADKQYILSILKNAKSQLQEKYGLKEIALFGSYSRGTHLNNTSDVDVMVEFNRPIGIAFIDLADDKRCKNLCKRTRGDICTKRQTKPG